MLTARVVVPTPPLGEKKVTISPDGRPERAASGVTRPARMSSASTFAASSWRAKPVLTTSSAPASRKAIRASTSSAGATTRTGVGSDAAARMRPMAPLTARPSAITRSNEPSRRAPTAAAGVVTLVVTYPADPSCVSSSARSSSVGAQIRIGLAAIGRFPA